MLLLFRMLNIWTGLKLFFCWFWPEMQCDSMQPAQQMAWPHYPKPIKSPHVTNTANEEQEIECFPAGHNRTESMSLSTVESEPVLSLDTDRILSLSCAICGLLCAPSGCSVTAPRSTRDGPRDQRPSRVIQQPVLRWVSSSNPLQTFLTQLLNIWNKQIRKLFSHCHGEENYYSVIIPQLKKKSKIKSEFKEKKVWRQKCDCVCFTRERAKTET